MTFSNNALTILKKRYYLPDEHTPEQLFRRVARGVSKAEDVWDESGEKREYWEERFYDRMLDQEMMPNSPTIFNADLGDRGCLSACFTIPIDDNLESIMEAQRQAAKVWQYGGGTGFNFGNLRPKGDPVNKVHGSAIGPVATMVGFDSWAERLTQGGKRKGANMGILPVSHPDIFEFIHCKDSGNTINNFNISVAITDDFMQCLSGNSRYGTWAGQFTENGMVICGQSVKGIDLNYLFPLTFGESYKVYRWVDARDLWQEIVESAWKTGDPGCYFIDTSEATNPTPHLGKLESTNPCCSKDTIILTRNGLRTIEELTDGGLHEVATVNGWSLGTAFKTGTKPIVKVKLSNGKQIRVTSDHRVLVGEEWIPAGDLQIGTKIPYVPHATDWGDMDRFPIGWEDPDGTLLRLGFIQGDGSFIKDSDAIYVNIGNDDGEVDILFGDCRDEGRKRYIPANHHLAQASFQFGMSREILPLRTLPEWLRFIGKREIGVFLKGLYSANGSVTGGRITFKSTCRELVGEMQIILSAFGFRPYITTNKPSKIQWHNGKYTSRESYDLNIAGCEADLFKEWIGFIQQYKMDKLDALCGKSAVRRLDPTVVSVEDDGIEDVYDFSVSDYSHSGWANGLIIHNCGEVPLLAYEPCNLLHINLMKFLVGEMLDNETYVYQDFDWDGLRSCIEDGVRFLDDVVEVNELPTPEIKAANLLTRKIGLGVMGWHDVLIALQVPYDSPEAVSLAEDVMRFINETAADFSHELAKERGAYPGWNGEGRMYRNATRTVIAPTGTTSLIADCSQGIEPYFAFDAIRTMEDGTELDVSVGRDDSPWMKSANEIGWKWHVLHQAAFQKYTDLACSKTINLPNSATVEDISNAYRLAYETKCKGVTVFRDGCRAELGVAGLDQVLKSKSTSPVISPSSHVSNSSFTPSTAHQAFVQKFGLGEMKGYLTVQIDDHKPTAIFINMAKGGTTLHGLSNSLAIATSLLLKSGTEVKDLASHFEGMDFEPSGMTGVPEVPFARSLPDFIARYLMTVFGGEVRVPEVKVNIGDLCPECGSAMYYAEGCSNCTNSSCGYSKCG